MYLNLD